MIGKFIGGIARSVLGKASPDTISKGVFATSSGTTPSTPDADFPPEQSSSSYFSAANGDRFVAVNGDILAITG